MRRLDLPPLWLLLALVLAWGVSWLDPWGLRVESVGLDLLAGLAIGGGLVLIAVAVAQLRRHRTAVLPRRDASTLLTSGVFRPSRNPIYLGMAVILLGWILRLGAPLALPLLPVFVWVIETRFIVPEEEMLRRRFGAAFARYEKATRRWI